MHYKNLLKKYKKLCKKRRRSSWRKYKETRQSVPEMVQLNNIIQKKRKNKINTFTKPNGSCSEPGRETLDILIKTHFPKATEKIGKKYTSENCHTRSFIMSKNTDWINIDRTREAMQCFEKKKPPGPDDIKPIIFEHLPANVLNHLVFIYRAVIMLRYTPLIWKGTKVIFIPKPCKPSYNIPKAFRPI